MRKKHQISEEESELFRQTLRGTQPITHTKVNKPIPAPKARVVLTEKPDEDPFSDYETLPSVTGDETIQYARPGLQHKILRNLRQGKYNAEAIIDLHGMTVEEARTVLYQFLLECQENHKRHVLIIHGKGRGDKPILKNKLNHWLRQIKHVLAFCSATARDGQGGALYVLLGRH